MTTTHDNAESSTAAFRPKGGRLPRNQRRAQLIASALEVFATEGYHAASMDDIASRAGVSKPVLYQHFPGKLELYLALLERSCTDIIDRVQVAFASATTPEQRVRASIAAFYDFVGDPSGAYHLVFASDLTSEATVQHQLQKTVTELAQIISEGFTERGQDAESAYLLTVSLIGMAETSARAWIQSGSSLSADRASTIIADLAWNGLSTNPNA